MNKEILKHIIRYILMIIVIVLCVEIFGFSNDTGEVSSGKSRYVARFLLNFSKEFREMSEEAKEISIGNFEPILRKIAHFCIYGLLGCLTFGIALTFKRWSVKKRILIPFIYCFLYAASDEMHQLFVSDRAGKIADVLLDTSGALLGIVVIFLLSNIILAIYKRFKKENKDKKKSVLFIASTGGHLDELLQLKSIFKDYNYQIVTEKTKVDDSFKKTYKERIHFLIYGTKKYPFTYIFKFLANCFISLFYYFRYQPEVIVTTGTHTAVPMCYIARIFGSKVIYIETFANRTTATVAGRIIYPIANTFVVQWEEMKEIYPKAVCWGWLY